MSLPVAFYRFDGQDAEEARFVATEATAGPWSPSLQHGGPVAALIARCVQARAGEGLPTTFRMELLRPVPVGPVAVRVQTDRSGRAVQTFSAELQVEGRTVVRAQALFARGTASLPAPGEPTAIPEVDSSFPMRAGYGAAMEGRVVAGAFGTSPCVAWMRPRIPLVEGEEIGAWERVLLGADAVSGIGAALSWDAWSFPNADLTVHLHRLPVGPWVRFGCSTALGAQGVAVAHGEIADSRGPIGHSLQSLVVGPR